MLALVAVTPSTVALTVAEPPFSAVIKPLLFTDRTFGLLLVQLVATPVSLIPDTCKKLPVTVACCVPAPIMLVLVSETASDVGVTLVITTLGPATALAARYAGETAPFQIRNSYMVP